jgi:hypothetical protein
VSSPPRRTLCNRPTGRLPVPGSYTAAPYYVAVSSDGSGASVWDALTSKKLGTVAAPDQPSARGRGHYRTVFASIAAACDDRTFVLASNTATPVRFFDLRLAPDGAPGPVRPLSFPRQRQGMVGRWYQNISSIALTADGTRLAIATNRSYGNTNGPADIEVVSLAAGATRTWTSTPRTSAPCPGPGTAPWPTPVTACACSTPAHPVAG